jgi:hypothetical protein
MVNNAELLDAFTRKEFMVNFPLLIYYLAIGFFGIYIENQFFALIYLLFIIFPFYLANRYFVCSKCYYYGKKCYLGGGKCSALLFKKRDGEYSKFENAFVGLTWMLTIFYPLYWLALQASPGRSFIQEHAAQDVRTLNAH